MQKEKLWKRFSVYQIVSFVLIVLLVLAICITIGVIVNLKSKIKNTQQKNEEIKELLPEDEPDGELAEDSALLTARKIYLNKITETN
jgi:Na+-translocating ferredoxin:NAD+ oxidoreductase RnfG subunit